MESTFPQGILEQAEALLNRCREKSLRLATAESCTGGLIAAVCTEIPGSSDVFAGGVVAYANTAKTACLGVPEALLAQHGAVSGKVARAMAEGALARLQADLAISVTGIAGPDGGSAEKPVGLVYIAVARAGRETQIQRFEFGDIGRTAVRWRTVEAALQMAIAAT